MRAVALMDCTVHDIFPRKFVDVIVHGARVGDQFHAIVQRAVCFDVEQVCMSIGNVQQFFRKVIISACSVNFQFDAKVTIAFAVENGIWLVAVFVNQIAFFTFILIAVTAVRFTVQIIGIILVQESITAAASGVVVVIAMAAKGDIVVTIDILVPNAFPTAFTGGSVVFQAVRTNDLSVPLVVIIIVNKASAALTIQGFFLFVLFFFYFFAHLKFLRKMKIALPIFFGRALCFGFSILLLRV